MASEAPVEHPERGLARQLATLVLARLPATAATAVQAAAWWNGLERLGLEPPLFVVHDLGVLLSRPEERRRVREQRRLIEPSSVHARYELLLQTVARSESLEALGGTFLRDEVIAVLLARLIGDVTRRYAARGAREAGQPSAPLPLGSALYAEAPATLARAFPPTWADAFLPALVEQELALVARLDQLDLGPIRLLGLFPPGAVPPDLVDVSQLLGATGVGEVVEFCLQLLPSLLETKRRGSPQTFAVDGFASVERRGSPDALLPSELAHDSDVFAVKALSDELLYYGHERPHEGGRRTHGVLVDASASMRGTREVFARGLALALAKKLSLMGVDVWVRFFDGRLHRRIEAGTLGGKDLPYLLCYRAERGRNYARVFQDLAAELDREASRSRRDLSLTFITHAECHIPRPLVEAVARRASLYGVFVLPSQPLAVEYLPLLRGHQVVTAEALAAPTEKRRRALQIVGDVVGDTRRR